MEQATAELVKAGILGALLVLAGWVIWQLKRDLIESLNAQIANAWKMAEIIGLNTTAQASIASASEARNRMGEEQAEAARLLAERIQALKEEIVRLGSRIDSLEKRIEQVQGKL